MLEFDVSIIDLFARDSYLSTPVTFRGDNLNIYTGTFPRESDEKRMVSLPREITNLKLHWLWEGRTENRIGPVARIISRKILVSVSAVLSSLRYRNLHSHN